MALNNEKESIVTVNNVSKRFIKSLDLAGKIAQRFGADIREEVVHAVDRVSLNIQDGEVVGLVGESGCGKSTLGRVVAGVHEPSEGNVLFRGKAIENLTGKDAQEAALKIQMIFQDPMSSLNPRLRVQDIIGEAPVVHGVVDSGNITDYVEEIMLRVGLDPSYARRYPHQFSGGQRQRIGIARALAVQPDFLVCDESVAALDVSIQAQVLNLFMRLREELNLTYLFISHDLGRLETRQRKFAPVKGEIPSPIDPPTGCHFHPRCPKAFARCHQETPALKEIESNRFSACHLND